MSGHTLAWLTLSHIDLWPHMLTNIRGKICQGNTLAWLALSHADLWPHMLTNIRGNTSGKHSSLAGI